MRFLCDMGVSMEVARWLRSLGHDVSHLCEEGLQRLPNGDIFTKAVSEDRVILTFDLDFGEIASMAGDRIQSVIVFRLRNTRSEHVIHRLAIALDRTIEVLPRRAIVVVEESRIRIRRLPIGGPE